MKAYFLYPLIAASIAGCAGLDITPISPDAERAAHAGNASLKGYVIYGSMAVVEVSRKEMCSDKDDAGKCKGTVEMLYSTPKP